MNTTLNTQVLASSVSGTVPSGQTERLDTQQVFKKLDRGDKGYLTADDLQAAVVKISAEGAQRADAAAQAAPSAQDVLAKLDGDGDGKVTQQEFKAAQPEAPPAGGGGSGGGAARGAPPAGAQAPARAGGGTATSGASKTQTYEPADTNEDGAISPIEQQAYDAKLAAEKAARAAEQAQNTAGGRSGEADAAVKAYESVEQLGAAAR